MANRLCLLLLCLVSLAENSSLKGKELERNALNLLEIEENKDGKIVAVTLEVVGVISGILGIYDSLSSKWGPSDFDQLNQQFNEAFYQLDQVNQKLDQMMAEIQVGFIKANLADDLKVISDCEFSLRNYLDCLDFTQDGDYETACAGKKDIFIGNAEGVSGNALENSIRHVMESMAGSVPGNDIPKTYREALDNYEYKLVDQLDQWMAWINVGIYVHGAYVENKGITVDENRFFRNYLDSTYNDKIPTKRENECILCRDEWKVSQEINEVLHDCQSLGNDVTVDQLWQKLADKYRTKRWFTTVYNDISGFNNHCLDGVFPSSFHQWGKNAFAYSVAQGSPLVEDQDRSYLNQHLNDKYCKATTRACDANAESTYNALNDGTGNRLHLAVIKRYNGLWSTWSDSLEPYFENGEYMTVIGLPDSAVNVYFGSSAPNKVQKAIHASGDE